MNWKSHRAAGESIGSGLAAEVDLYCEPKLYDALAKIGDELRFVLITSSARIHPTSARDEHAVATAIIRNCGLRFLRPPMKNASVAGIGVLMLGSVVYHPGLCERCVENVIG